MSKRKVGFFTKVKMFHKYLKSPNWDALVESCEFCESLAISKSDNTLEEIVDVGHTKKVYTVKYTCRNCGATANAKEVWTPNT